MLAVVYLHTLDASVLEPYAAWVRVLYKALAVRSPVLLQQLLMTDEL